MAYTNPTRQCMTAKGDAIHLVSYHLAAPTPRLRPGTRLSSHCWVHVPADWPCVSRNPMIFAIVFQQHERGTAG